MATTARQAVTSRRFELPVEASDRSLRIALIAAITALITFVIVSVLSYGKSYLAEPVDLWWNDLMGDGRSDVGLFLAWIPAVVGGPMWMLVIGLVIVGTFLLLRWKLAALMVAAAMVTSVILASPLSFLVAKTRPEGSLAESVPTSFPSGHTAMAATLAVIFGFMVRHWIAWVLGVVWVVLMAWGRTYLQAHWLTDVIAGACLGVIAGSMVWYSVNTIRRRRAASSGS